MIVRPGNVYRDNGVDFIVATEHIDGERHSVRLRLINVTNWIVLAGHVGKALSGGGVEVLDMTGEVIAETLADYYTPQRKKRKVT